MLISNSFPVKFNEKSESGEKKIKKNMFWGLNWPFIEVGHFENTIVIDLEIPTEIKIKFPNTSK